MNDKVPDSVKQSYKESPIYDYNQPCNERQTIVSTFPPNIENRNEHVCKQCDAKTFENCIIKDHQKNDMLVLKINMIIQ